jgi:hypothetical protein
MRRRWASYSFTEQAEFSHHCLRLSSRRKAFCERGGGAFLSSSQALPEGPLQRSAFLPDGAQLFFRKQRGAGLAAQTCEFGNRQYVVHVVCTPRREALPAATFSL